MAKDQKNHILWVDDDLYFYKSFEEELAETFDIEIVRNADDFWKKLIGSSPAYYSGIIMDIILPFGDMVKPEQAEGGLKTGIALVEMIKKTELYKDVPIVIFTIRDASDVDDIGKKYDIPVFRKSQVRMEDFVETIKERFR
jgi:DNA-binding NarL/FixJ family response regulator